MPNICKPVYQTDAKTGEIIAGFPSTHRAAIAVGTNPALIRRAIVRGGMAAGYRWKYQNPETSPHASHGFPRRVTQWSLAGEMLCVYDSMAEAAQLTGVPYCRICHCCQRNASAYTSGGYRWTYYPEALPDELVPRGGFRGYHGGFRGRRTSAQYDGRPVRVTDGDGRSETFDNVYAARGALGLANIGTNDAIYKVLNGEPHHLTAYGYKWAYADAAETDA